MTIKHFYFVFIFILSCMTFYAWGEETSTFRYSVVEKQVVITGIIKEKKEISIPATIDDLPVTGIVDQTIANCQTIISVNIPSSVTMIGEEAFAGCQRLEAVNVVDENEKFASVNGVLFSIDKKTFIL